MTILDIAQEMKGKLRDGSSTSQAGGASQAPSMSYGTATADSANGFVTIIMDNAVADGSAYDPADYEFTVACDAPISNGDRVAYIVIDGVGKAISLGTVADMAEQAASDASTAETNAATALSIANATGQYFFHDSNGAHVTTTANSPNVGRNVILNTNGLLFRNAATNLAFFTPTSIALGMNSSTPTSSSTTGSVSITLLNLISLATKYISVSVNGASHMAVGLDISGGDTQVENLVCSGLGLFDGTVLASDFYDDYGSASIRGAAACLTNSTARSVTTSLAKVTLGNTISTTSTDLFTKSSNGIKCNYSYPATATGRTVLVSASIYCEEMGSGNNLQISIYQNSTEIAKAVGSSSTSAGVATVSITPRTAYASPGDVFYLYAKTTTAVTSGIPIGGACLTVQYI